MAAAGRLLLMIVAFGLARDARGDTTASRRAAAALTRACLACHGPERQAGGLRVDDDTSLQSTVRAGHAARSPLWRRLRGLDGVPRMPKDAKALPASDVDAIARWIDLGAPALGLAAPATTPRGHWAYAPPARPLVPPVKRASWVRTPIDAFVLGQLERTGRAPAPEATPAALVRRVFLDLTGLPPTLADVDTYAAESARRPDAYERLVDRLLASPAYGERWAVPWLDAARYADSNGYEKDERRSMWPYRDWVVNALNADMPFDRFATEQLAGDLLPGAGTSQRVATGFHRNTMANEEGGVDPAEARWERLVDRASTTATVFMAATLGCAQCHDHKHDPYSQRDFYALLAHFEDAEEATLELPSEAQARRLGALRAEKARLEAELSTWTPALGDAQRAWEKEQLDLTARWTVLRPQAVRSVAGAALTAAADGAIAVGAAPTPDEQVFEATTSLSRITGVRLEALPDAGLPGGGPGRGANGHFLLGGFVVEVAPAAGAFAPIAWRAALADDKPREEPERYGIETLLSPTTPADGPRGWGVFASYDGSERRPRQGVFVPVAPFGFAGGTRLRVRLRYPGEAAGETIGRVRLSVTGEAAPEAIVALDARLRPALARPEAERPRQTRDQLAQAFRLVAPQLAGTRARSAALRREEESLAVASTLVFAPARDRRAVTPLRRGGAFARPGVAITAAPPAVFSLAMAPAPTRLGLARWLFDPRNPLTARVAANRIWAGHFGRGLVETVEDFGTSGARPTHPELLDWLAAELVARGWSQKALHRLIVTSSVYRQASDRRAGSAETLAHMPRLRLDAEAVRDLALAVSGLLDPRRGGPPVFPPLPASVWARPNSRDVTYPESRGGDAHRRALYTFWRRTVPYPTATLFDAPSREICAVRRARARTPLQALATLNDPVFWEAAESLGRRMQNEPPARAPLDVRLAHGFRLCTGRPPRAAELRPLRSLWARTAAGTNPGHAFSLVANVLLNLDETLTRG